MFHADAEIDADFLGFLDVGFGCAAGGAIGHEFCHVRAVRGDGLGQRMIGREREEAGAEQRVGARGEDFDRIGRVVAALAILVARQEVGNGSDVPPDLRALRFADPVALHGADLVGPAVERVQGVEQIIAIARDAEEPLFQLALFDDGAGTPPASIDDLFVGQHGILDRIPVHFRGAAIDEIVGQHLQEDALLLFVIVRLAGGDFLRPVERQAERRKLVLHRLDVLQRPSARLRLLFDGGVLGGQAERIPSHRVQDVITVGDAIARDHVAHGVVAHMAHVQPARRVGEHLKDVGLRHVARFLRGLRTENLRAVPRGAPFRLSLFGIVAGGHLVALVRSVAEGGSHIPPPNERRRGVILRRRVEAGALSKGWRSQARRWCRG